MNFSLGNLLSQELTSISAGQLLAALGLAFALSLYVVLIYRLIYTGVMFSSRFALSLVLLAMVTSVVILAISSNVVLSLGMVGALSIVRFRTAVKDVMDTVFMFWAIVVGIVCGAGFVLVSLIATLVIGLVVLGAFYLSKRMRASSYLVVVRMHPAVEVAPLLKVFRQHQIKSHNLSEQVQELVVEAKLTEKQLRSVRNLLSTEGVKEVNLVAYNSQTTL